MKVPAISNLILPGLLIAGAVQADSVGDLLAHFRGQGAGPFDAGSGQALWGRSFPSVEGPSRSCASCHSSDPTRRGRHAVTGKAIEPIAPSAYAKRLTDHRQIEKWLNRNCKWTLGRECTPQEKGDILSFLRDQ